MPVSRQDLIDSFDRLKSDWEIPSPPKIKTVCVSQSDWDAMSKEDMERIKSELRTGEVKVWPTVLLNK